MRFGPFAFRYQGNGATPANILIPLERQLIVLQLCRWLFDIYCRNCPKDDKFRYFIPILRKLGRRRTFVDGSLESPCRVLVKYNWTSFSFSCGWGGTRQKCQNSLHSGGRSIWTKILGEGVVHGEYFLASTKLHTFCYPTVQTAPYYVPSFWHNTGVCQTDGQTDRQIDSWNCYS